MLERVRASGESRRTRVSLAVAVGTAEMHASLDGWAGAWVWGMSGDRVFG